MSINVASPLRQPSNGSVRPSASHLAPVSSSPAHSVAPSPHFHNILHNYLTLPRWPLKSSHVSLCREHHYLEHILQMPIQQIPRNLFGYHPKGKWEVDHHKDKFHQPRDRNMSKGLNLGDKDDDEKYCTGRE